jgi:Ca2+/Na+ antiporter
VELGSRLRARGASRITTPDGRTVDFLELLARDPAAAGELAAAIGTAVTAAAQRSGGVLSFDQASAAARHGAVSGLGRKGPGSSAAGGAFSPRSDAAAVAPLLPSPASAASRGATAASSSDYLSILPHETIKPIADCYLRLKRAVGVVAPVWHGFMHIAELPVTVARKLTVPVMHEGAYRRRLLCLTMPGSFAFFTLVLTTHILKGGPTGAGGFPYWVIAGMVGGAVGVLLHFTLPSKHSHAAHPRGDAAEASQSQALLTAAPGAGKRGSADAAKLPGASAAGAPEWGVVKPAGLGVGGPQPHATVHKKRPWYRQLGIIIAGPNDHPAPRGAAFGVLMVLSFLQALFWLLVIATEIVGTAIFIGKTLHIPDVVMGLTVLAVGNSINDLAASLTIARDGYASMAVAGAYAGPMFNVLAGACTLDGRRCLLCRASPDGPHD